MGTSSDGVHQMQGIPKRYKNVTAFVVHTYRESGLVGFYRGMLPALVMIAPQMGVSFAVYEVLKHCVVKPGGELNSGKKRGMYWLAEAWSMVAGGVAGMSSKLVVFPIDTVKKRLQKEVRGNGGGGR